MNGPRRRFPRIPYTQPGEVVLRVPASGVRACSFRDVSPDGMGLIVGLDCPVRPGEQLAIRIRMSGRQLEIPARVVHASATARDRAIGIKLHLALAPSATRQAYARWIVAMITAVA